MSRVEGAVWVPTIPEGEKPDITIFPAIEVPPRYEVDTSRIYISNEDLARITPEVLIIDRLHHEVPGESLYEEIPEEPARKVYIDEESRE